MTALDFTDATEVCTPYGWYDVIAVNATTVTVSGDFDDFRIPKTKILEVRS